MNPRQIARIAAPRIAGLLILGAVALIYANSLGNDFQYDDRHSIVENPHIRSLRNVPAFFTRPELFSRDADKAMYRPLVLVSLAINYAWSGYETYSYHLVNIAAHGLCALLVWGILLQLGPSPGFALFGGLLFAVHPVCSESVNYISSRSELLAGLGVLASYWLHLVAQRRGGWPVRAGSVLCFGLGVLAKSVAIVLPALLIMGDWCWRGIDRRRVLQYLPYAAVALAYLAGIRTFLARAVVSDPVRAYSEQLGTQTKAVAYYLKLLCMPVDLSVDHAFSEASLLAGIAVLALLAVATLLVMGWTNSRRHSFFFLGSSWMAITLGPTLLVPLNVLVNEHRLYLPLVGMIILLGGLGKLDRMWKGQWIGPVCLGLLALLSAQRNRVWANEHTLWADAARKGPELVRPYVYMGNYARAVGDPQKAVAFFGKALQREPENITARNNLANAYKDLGEMEMAIQTYEETLAEYPEAGNVRYNLALAHQLSGESWLTKAHRLAFPDSRFHREKALGELSALRNWDDRPDDALVYYRRVLEDLSQAKDHYLAVPDSSFHRDLALNNLGTLHELAGRPDSSLIYYQKALEVKPESIDPRGNLQRLQGRLMREAESFLESGNYARAERNCRMIVHGEPRQRDARFLLAVSLFYQARYGESIQENQKLVDMHPDFDEGRLQMANVLESSGRLKEAQQTYEILLQRTRRPDMRQLTAQRLQALMEKMR